MKTLSDRLEDRISTITAKDPKDQDAAKIARDFLLWDWKEFIKSEIIRHMEMLVPNDPYGLKRAYCLDDAQQEVLSKIEDIKKTI